MKCAKAKYVLLLAGLACVGTAQDRRIVREPTLPTACISLRAELRLDKDHLDPADESKLDTARVQKALDDCSPGRAVELAAGSTSGIAFLVGPIHIPAGVTLQIDRGVTLLASRDARLYDLRPGSCGLVNDEPDGCQPVISIAQAPHAAIMGDGVIDGRGGESLLHESGTWWGLAEKARAGGRQQVPRLIVADGSDDFTLYRVTLRNSSNFHVVYRNGHGFTVWDLKIDTPRTARNTDGIDPMSAEDITVTHSLLRTGDDNIAIKGTEGGVGYMSVIDNHFYHGHGMSIGSETFGGVHDILVEHLSLDGPDNGIRIKSNPSRGGLVERITYTDVCIRNSKNPIVFDTHYSFAGARTDLHPEFRNIELKNVRISGGGRIRVEGLDAQHRILTSFNGVTLDDTAHYQLSAMHASIHSGPRPVNFELRGDDVANSGRRSNATLASCKEMFIPFDASK